MLTRQMFSLWLEPLPTGMTSIDILELTDTLIGQFWRGSSHSLRYAPYTIAISALLLAFSKCKMNCSSWLQRLPDGMFPSRTLSSSLSSTGGHPIFATHEMSFLDIDSCLLAMMGEERTGCLSHRTTPTKHDNICHTPTSMADTDTTAIMTLSPCAHHRTVTPTTTCASSPDHTFST